jgi:oligopeptide transport system substrate-binding protein
MTTGARAADQILRLSIGGEPQSIDPSLAHDLRSVELLRQLTRPLVYFDKDLKLVPGLASSWDVTPDGTQITFHLRDAKYSNGDPIVAEDFVYSWKRVLDPRIAAEYAYVMEDVAGAAELLEIDTEAPPADAEIDALLAKVGVSAPDARTFVVKLAAPAAYFLSIATLWVAAPIQKAWIEQEGATEAGKYVSSGPFILETWEHNAKIALVPNPQWYGDKPKLARIEYTVIEDATAALNAYEAGNIDVAGLPATDIARICGDPTLKSQMVATSTAGFELEREDSLFRKSVHLRRAFSMAIDKQTLIDTVRQGAATLAGSPVPPGIVGHQPEIGLKYDPEGAKQELQLALTELGLANVADLQLKLGYNTPSDLHPPTAAFIQEQWRTVLGVDVTSTGVETNTYYDEVRAGAFDIHRASWTMDYPHPNNFVGDVFGTGNNRMGYSSAALDALIKDAALKPKLEDQLPIYAKAQQQIVDDAPVIFLYWYGGFTLVKPWVEGIVLTGQDEDPGMLFFEQISIAEH